MSIDKIESAIRNVSDFPIEGIQFKDITPILSNPELFRTLIDLLIDRYRDQHIDKIAAIDARGFILGAPLAYKLGVGIVPVRKKGKLPHDTIEVSYDLEYGSNTLEMHVDAIEPGERVLLIDDLLATGGTAQASIELIKRLKGELVEVVFLVELAFLKGREKLGTAPVFSPIVYHE